MNRTGAKSSEIGLPAPIPLSWPKVPYVLE